MYVYNIYIYLRYIYIDIFRPHEPLRLQPTVAPPCGGLPWGGTAYARPRWPAKTIASPIYEPTLWPPPQSIGGAFS